MGLRIQTNTQSLNTQRSLSLATEANNQSMEKLSSGSRINKAADDAAGLAISEKLKADIRGLGAARRNASDGISLVQTAEGGLNEIGNILSRLRELAVQGASDTIGNTEREFLNKEFLALKSEIDRISTSTEYNGTRLLIGEQEGKSPSLTNKSNPFPLEIQVGKDFFKDVDAKDQPGVNLIRIDLKNINSTTEGKGSLDLGNTQNPDGIQVKSKEHSQRTIAKVDDAITKVSGYRADLGAIQNRLMSTVGNLNVQMENFAAANSRIRDTDFAEETGKMVQTSILKQSGIAVLTQANQSPQLALRLLA